MPASAVYYFPLPILSFISAAVRGRNSPWQQGSFYPVRLTDTFSVLSARTLAFGRILLHTTGSLLLARKFPAVYTAVFQINSQPCQTLPPVPPPLRASLKLPPGKILAGLLALFYIFLTTTAAGGEWHTLFLPACFLGGQPFCCSASVFSGDTRFPAPDCRAGWPWGWEAAISLSGHGFPPVLL